MVFVKVRDAEHLEEALKRFKRECEKKLYSKIKSIKIIQANMLSEKEYYHDLINKEVIDLLNLQKEELTTPKIIYSKYETPEKWLNF